MTRKIQFERRHFEFIAQIINRLALSGDDLDEVAAEFADALKSTNPAFDKERFIRACLKG